MNRQETKFLLSAYRPNGADALDQNLAEALRFAQHDPELAPWFAAQRKFDEAVAGRLQEVHPPAEMRDQLHAGMELPRHERRPTVKWGFALIALALMATVPVGVYFARLSSIYFMNQTFLYTLTVTGFGVAFLHAAIPTHWLPFVVVGRARGWSHRRILAAVALAGGGHVIATTALGLGLAWFGFELSER